MRFFRHKHDWFPDLNPPMEFIPTIDICLRSWCKARRVNLPWGQCLGGHPIAEHYDAEGELIPHALCLGGPR